MVEPLLDRHDIGAIRPLLVRVILVSSNHVTPRPRQRQRNEAECNRHQDAGLVAVADLPQTGCTS